ncbi:hypothetical protein ESP51_20420, partial [Agromyces albus]
MPRRRPPPRLRLPRRLIRPRCRPPRLPIACLRPSRRSPTTPRRRSPGSRSRRCSIRSRPTPPLPLGRSERPDGRNCRTTMPSSGRRSTSPIRLGPRRQLRPPRHPRSRCRHQCRPRSRCRRPLRRPCG